MAGARRTSPGKRSPNLGFFCALLVLAACGGTGTGKQPAPAFAVVGSTPANGVADADPGSSILVAFSLATDLRTISGATLRLESCDGTALDCTLEKQEFNPALIRIVPTHDLKENSLYRIRIGASIKSLAGETLGEEVRICFATASDGPSVRPDQIVDLGERLNVPRYLACWARGAGGCYFIFGGYADRDSATDTIEVYDPASRSFRLLSARMTSPRAEHTATRLNDGNILLAGGVTHPGRAPLATTEIFHLAYETCSPGPVLLEPRRLHATTLRESGSSLVVAGGYGIDGEMLDSIECTRNGVFERFPDPLPAPSAELCAIPIEFDEIYFTASNAFSACSIFYGSSVTGYLARDQRTRASWLTVDAGVRMVVGGDSRTILFLDQDWGYSYLAHGYLRERRGGHTLTRRGENHYLVAGGFNIGSNNGEPLSTLEIVEYEPPDDLAGTADASVFAVGNVELPVAFAGHIGFTELAGPTLLAGGWRDGEGEHSRRVVLILDDRSKPHPDCGEASP